ncbi:tRNA (guanosine(37)-N1)-methyltransferase TrmD [Sutterella sp.]|uniref:tRNA (guanosine(37)-N1)-methyltransferase TrmD n=1 Tax=Sutterella sp. TaxID=1981025 RepID=UPI0026DEB596|nr:tRNA (guanosine(37)-N1)-methyltransferase TrmD [Sutterella sp.]MDO5531935.1 tRNA (guanosine(37)-N1)-methyltransferase TrmD [Sutterella sp.]
MRFDVITLFPEIFATVADCGITARARKRGLWSLNCWNPRDTATDLHRTIDDRPFGGGPGMVMMAEPLAQTLDAVRASGNRGRVVSFAPNGARLTDKRVRELAAEADSLVLICGRYEGIDERFLSTEVDEVISLGDFVLSGGELPACALIDAVVRQLPGAIKDLSASDESFATGLLDAPHYTRPEVWRGMAVPDVLLSGHHKNIARWTREKSLELTLRTRPELVNIADSSGLLSREDMKFLRGLGWKNPSGK